MGRLDFVYVILWILKRVFIFMGWVWLGGGGILKISSKSGFRFIFKLVVV